MDANILFGKALGLGSGWKVVKSEMDVVYPDYPAALSLATASLLSDAANRSP